MGPHQGVGGPTASCATARIISISARMEKSASPPRRILFTVFLTKADGYIAWLKGKTAVERAKVFERLRDSEGYMSNVETEPELRILEHHSPILDLLRAFPITARLESEMFQRVLGAVVTREEITASGQYFCAFKIDARK